MPDKKGRLSPAELAFASAYASTSDSGYSAKQAGYRSQAGGSMALQRPAVQAEIARIQLARLYDEGLPIAVEAHIALIKSPATAAGAKVQAIKLLYDRTIGAGEQAIQKELHEMTSAEIDATIDKLKRLASDKALPIVELEAEADQGVLG